MPNLLSCPLTFGLVLALQCATAFAAVPDTVYHPDYSGPLWTPGPSALTLENFEGEAVTVRAYGEATFTTEKLPCDAPCGGRALTLRLTAVTGLRGEHGVDVSIPLGPGRTNWSDYDGLEFWVRTPAGSAFDVGRIYGGVRGRIDITVWTDGEQADERRRQAFVIPATRGKWQRIAAPFDMSAPVHFPYFGRRWRSKADAERGGGSATWLGDLSRLQLRVPASSNVPVEITLAGVGLYRNPPLDTPSVALQTAAAGGMVFTTGEPFALTVGAEHLPVDRRADIAMEVVDFSGRVVHREMIPVARDARRGGRFERELRWPNGTPGWFEARATLQVDGKPVFRASRGLASLPALTPAQDAARHDSIFGIWPDVHPALGAGIARKPFKAWEDKPNWQPLRLPHESVAGIAWVIGAPWENGKWFAVNSEGYEAWGERLTKAVRQVTPDGRWRYYGAINEPSANYWGPMENVVEYHRAVYEAVKRGDPAAKVGGPCPHDISIDYLEKFVVAGGAQWIDFFDVHGYSANDRDFEEKLEALHAFLRKHNLENKEIILTETGYSIPVVTAEQQAALLVRTYAVALSQKVKVVVWHALFSTGLGNIASPDNRPTDNRHANFNIIRTDGSANPAFVAYGIMTRLLLGARYVEPVQGLPEGCVGFAFEREGKRIRVLWSRQRQTHDTALAVNGDAAVTDLMGVSRPLAADSDGTVRLTLAEAPLYLIDSN